HVELPGVRRRTVRIGGAENEVRAKTARPGDLDHAASERRDAHAWTPSACSSCSDNPGGWPSRSAAIARAAAIPPASVVTHGTPRATPPRRISYPSERAAVPGGVLITRSTSPLSIQSTTCGEPSWILFSVSTG